MVDFEVKNDGRILVDLGSYGYLLFEMLSPVFDVDYNLRHYNVSLVVYDGMCIGARELSVSKDSSFVFKSNVRSAVRGMIASLDSFDKELGK